MSAAGSPASQKKSTEGLSFTAVNSPAKAATPEDTLKRKRLSSASSHKTTPRAKKKAKAQQAWQPPKHLDSWEGLADITAVMNNDSGRLSFALLWNGGQTSMHPAPLVNVKMPQTVIRYYESNLVLEDANEANEAESSAEGNDQDSIPEVMQSDDEEATTSKPTPVSSTKSRKRESTSQKVSNVKPSPAAATKAPPKTAALSAKGTPTKGKARTKPKVQESYWEIEDISGDRIRNGKKQYRVRWVGYSAKHDTWVPEEHSLEDCPEAVQEYLEKKANEAAAVEEAVDAVEDEEIAGEDVEEAYQS